MPKKTDKTEKIATVNENQIDAPVETPVEAPAVKASNVEAAITSRQDEQAAMIQRLMEQNQQLMAALALTNVGKKAEEPKYKIVNTMGSSVSFEVTNPTTGNKEPVHLHERGHFKELTLAQITDLRDRHPFLFDDGLVSAPDVVPDSPNVIPNIGKFVADLSFDDIDERIAAITSPDVLWALWNHIETQRFTNVDANGVTLTEKEGEITRPVMKEVVVSPKLRTLQMAVQGRITALTTVIPRMA